MPLEVRAAEALSALSAEDDDGRPESSVRRPTLSVIGAIVMERDIGRVGLG